MKKDIKKYRKIHNDFREAEKNYQEYFEQFFGSRKKNVQTLNTQKLKRLYELNRLLVITRKRLLNFLLKNH